MKNNNNQPPGHNLQLGWGSNHRNANFVFVSKKSKMKKQQQSTSGKQKATTYMGQSLWQQISQQQISWQLQKRNNNCQSGPMT